MLRVYIIY